MDKLGSPANLNTKDTAKELLSEEARSSPVDWDPRKTSKVGSPATLNTKDSTKELPSPKTTRVPFIRLRRRLAARSPAEEGFRNTFDYKSI